MKSWGKEVSAMTVRDLAPWKWGKKDVAVRRDLNDPFDALRRQMDRMLEEFSEGFGITPFNWGNRGLLEENWGGYWPQIDVTEDEKGYTVMAELPGLEEKDVEVTLSDNALTLRGEKKREFEEKDRNFYRMERSYGTFQRTIPIPAEVDEARIEASFKKGVLTVTLPKNETARKEEKKIKVKAE